MPSEQKGHKKAAFYHVSQILWHLEPFRQSFKKLDHHVCTNECCMYCILKEVFSTLQCTYESLLAPDILRKALSKTVNSRQFLCYTNDAAECFEYMLYRLHLNMFGSEDEEMCTSPQCLPHRHFAAKIVEQNVCQMCGASSEPLPFTQLVHYVSATALIGDSYVSRFPEKKHSSYYFSELLQWAGKMGDIRNCPVCLTVETKIPTSSFVQNGCGPAIVIRRTLLNQPDVLCIGVIWDSEKAPSLHIRTALGTVGPVLYAGRMFPTQQEPLKLDSPHYLIALVAYRGKHYVTFLKRNQRWLVVEEGQAWEAGSCWEHVTEVCRKASWQPLLLFYSRLIATAELERTPWRSVTPTFVTSGDKDLQRRAITPSWEISPQSPKVSSLHSPGDPFLCVPGSRDSGVWSGDRNSASSSSSVTIEATSHNIITNHSSDLGYDSYSLSSTDSCPVPRTDFDDLCHRSDGCLREALICAKNGNLVGALTNCNKAAVLARAAMNAPYTSAQALAMAQKKHNSCLLQMRNLERQSLIEHSSSPEQILKMRKISRIPRTGALTDRRIKSKSDPTLRSVEIYGTLPKRKETSQEKSEITVTDSGTHRSRLKNRHSDETTKRAKSEDRKRASLPKEDSKKFSIASPIPTTANENRKHRICRKLLPNRLMKRINRSMPDLRDEQEEQVKDSKRKICVGSPLIPRRNSAKLIDTLSGYTSEGHNEFSNPTFEKSKLMRQSFHGNISATKVPPPVPQRTVSKLRTNNRKTVSPQQNTNSQTPNMKTDFNSTPVYTQDKVNNNSLSRPSIGLGLSAKIPTYSVVLPSSKRLLDKQILVRADVHKCSANAGLASHYTNLNELYECNGTTQDLLYTSDDPLPPYPFVPSDNSSCCHSRQSSEEFPPPPPPLETAVCSQLPSCKQDYETDVPRIDTKNSQEQFHPALPPKIKDRPLNSSKNSIIRELKAKQLNSLVNDANGKKLRLPSPNAVSPLYSQAYSNQAVGSSPNERAYADSSVVFPSYSVLQGKVSKQCRNRIGETHIEGSVDTNPIHKVDNISNEFNGLSLGDLSGSLQRNTKNNIRLDSEQFFKETTLEHAYGRQKHTANIDDNVDSVCNSKQSPGYNRVSSDKKKSKKNVTFCDDVVLVSTKEEDENESNYPNPILERVLSCLNPEKVPQRERCFQKNSASYNETNRICPKETFNGVSSPNLSSVDSSPMVPRKSNPATVCSTAFFDPLRSKHERSVEDGRNYGIAHAVTGTLKKNGFVDPVFAPKSGQSFSDDFIPVNGAANASFIPHPAYMSPRTNPNEINARVSRTSNFFPHPVKSVPSPVCNISNGYASCHPARILPPRCKERVEPNGVVSPYRNQETPRNFNNMITGKQYDSGSFSSSSKLEYKYDNLLLLNSMGSVSRKDANSGFLEERTFHPPAYMREPHADVKNSPAPVLDETCDNFVLCCLCQQQTVQHSQMHCVKCSLYVSQLERSNANRRMPTAAPTIR